MNPEINLSPDAVSALACQKPGHEVIIKQIIVQVETHPEEQEAFIAFLFSAMSVEGDSHVTDMRDAALTILADTQIQPIIKSNSGFVLTTYIRSVRTQTWENDPYSGSIATLLEAGKVVASALSPNKRDLNRIIEAWQKVSGHIPEAENRKCIYKAVGEIKHTVRPVGPRPATVELDNQVEALSNQGLSRKQIAEILHMSFKLMNQIEDLTVQRVSRKEIAEILNVPLYKIDSLRSLLRKRLAGRAELMKRGRPKKVAIISS